MIYMAITKAPARSNKIKMSIILPVYNEEDNIRLQYEEIISAVNPLKLRYEIIFVDDGSADSSVKILR